MIKLQSRCTFVVTNRGAARCKNRIYKNKLCKLHHDGRMEGKHIENVPRAISIYMCGLEKREQDLYEDVTVGNLRHEIKVAKLQLRRILLLQYEYDSAPEDVNNMKVSSITLRDTLVLQGKLVDTMGIPIELLTAAKDAKVSGGKRGDVEVLKSPMIESTAILSRPDFEGQMDRIFNVIIRLERANYELMGGTSGDPNHLAKQVLAAIESIEENAQGADL